MIRSLTFQIIISVSIASCASYLLKNNDFSDDTNLEIKNAVRNVSLIIFNANSNLDPVGANENEIFEPSFYFGIKPIWMREPLDSTRKRNGSD